MEMLAEVIVIIASILCFFYTVLIAKFCFGWAKTKYTKGNLLNEDVCVSVLIAARNEENNMAKIVKQLSIQSYPKNKFEILIVDDSSTDSTVDIVKRFQQENKSIDLKLISLKDNQSGKKEAIKEGIRQAKGELIITTDADCFMNITWIETIAAFYRDTNAKMIVAPVCFYEENSIFEKIQTLEFLALMSSTGGSLFFNKAIMCNGANLAYPKNIFEEVKGFEGISNTVSGDDVLLMYKVKNKYPDGIKFLKNADAIIYTKAKLSVCDFVNQRKRWASKRFPDLNSETKFVSLIVYFFNLFLLILPAVAFFNNTISLYPYSLVNVFAILFTIKSLIDFLLLFLSTSFFKKKKLLIYFLPEQIIYLFYVVLVGFLGLSRKYEWKERTINEK